MKNVQQVWDEVRKIDPRQQTAQQREIRRAARRDAERRRVVGEMVGKSWPKMQYVSQIALDGHLDADMKVVLLHLWGLSDDKMRDAELWVGVAAVDLGMPAARIVESLRMLERSGYIKADARGLGGDPFGIRYSLHAGSAAPTHCSNTDCVDGCVEADVSALLDRAGSVHLPKMKTGWVSATERKRICDRDGWTCVACGLLVNPWAVSTASSAPNLDHIIPRSRGGSDDPANLRLLCRGCNVSRGNRLEPDVMEAFGLPAA